MYDKIRSTKTAFTRLRCPLHFFRERRNRDPLSHRTHSNSIRRKYSAKKLGALRKGNFVYMRRERVWWDEITRKGGRESTADKRGDHLIEKREREEKRVTGERGGKRLRSSMMRGEWGRRRVVWTEERPRGHPQDGWSGRQKESTRGVRGGHPRDAQAPCEGGKAGESCSLRPGHLTILRRERSEGDTRRDEARQETHRGRRETGGERKIIERRGRKSARARDEGAQREREGEEPLEKPGRTLCRRHRPPRSSARAAVDVSCEGKPPSCESASGDRCTLDTLKRSACEEREKEGEERGRNEVGNARRVRENGGRFGPGSDAQGW